MHVSRARLPLEVAPLGWQDPAIALEPCLATGLGRIQEYEEERPRLESRSRSRGLGAMASFPQPGPLREVPGQTHPVDFSIAIEGPLGLPQKGQVANEKNARHTT
jgi:hypothetical protein